MFQKTVACLLVVIVLWNISNLNAYTDEELELMGYLHSTCIGTSSAPEEIVKNAQSGNFADDQRLKCYIFCIMKEAGGADDDGVLDPEAIIAMVPVDLQESVGASVRECCAKAVTSDACERSWLAHKCFYEKDPANYFLP